MAYINKPKKVDSRVPTIKQKESQKIYQSHKWKKLRESKRLNNPLCESCLEKGLTIPTVDIHHIIPFSKALNQLEKNILAFSYENLQSVCSDCHDKLHRNYVEDIELRKRLLKR